MDFGSSSRSGIGKLVTALGLTGLLAVSLAGDVAADTKGGAPGAAFHGAPLQGVWGVEVTRRNCDDPSVTLGPPFRSIVTFAEGGTIVESAGALGFAPDQRSIGHGTWSRTGRHTYRQRMLALILFDTPANPPASPGFFQGWQTVTHTVTVHDQDNFTSSGRNWFYRADGTEYRSGCSTAVGQRFK